jgi:probable F420-dependent oxidoreductase
MLIGATMFATDFSLPPQTFAALLEERGFESVWFPEHTHIPVSRRSPWPGGGPLPEEYWHGYDPFIALTAAAIATTHLKLGTGVCLVVQRDPIITAKEVASLDHLSHGRVLFGVGGGWNAEEMEDHDTPFRRRWRLLRERILAMKAIWTQDEAEFHGQLVSFDGMLSFPKPLQKPHPPVLMGGDGPGTLDRAVELADGWMPLGGRRRGGPSLDEKVAALRQRARDAGRNPDSISVSVFGSRPERGAVDRLEQAGAERVIIEVPSAGREVVEPLLDRIASALL